MTITAADLIGQPVLTMSIPELYLYEGPDDLGFESIRYGATIGIATAFDRIAPADTPIPAADDRVQVEKRPMLEARRAGHYGRGSWRLALPDRPYTWHNTKGEAVAAGLRRLAILDWHAAQSEAA